MADNIYRANFLGSYCAAISTGAETTIAAGTGSAGHIYALRWNSTTKIARIRSIRCEATVTVGFTAAQEFGHDVFHVRSYSASHGGANSLVVSTGNNFKMRGSYPTTAVESIRCGGTLNGSSVALTAGTQTFDSNPLMTTSLWCLAGTAGGRIDKARDWGAGQGEFILETDTGIVIRNRVLMGAAGIVPSTFTIEWDEYQTIT